MPVVVLRPQPGCAASVAAARALGLDAEGFPLFAIAARSWQPPARDSFDALLLGSANAVRHAGPVLAAWHGTLAYAVGEQTARAAAQAGLEVIAVGRGGLQQVLGLVRPDHPRLLRLAGETRVPLDPPPVITIAEAVVYASVALPMPDTLVRRLREPALMLLHSAEAARHFADQCDTRGIARAHLSLAALGPRISAAAGDGWGRIAHAAQPDEAALLALAAAMCDKPWR